MLKLVCDMCYKKIDFNMEIVADTPSLVIEACSYCNARKFDTVYRMGYEAGLHKGTEA